MPNTHEGSFSSQPLGCFVFFAEMFRWLARKQPKDSACGLEKVDEELRRAFLVFVDDFFIKKILLFPDSQVEDLIFEKRVIMTPTLFSSIINQKEQIRFLRDPRRMSNYVEGTFSVALLKTGEVRSLMRDIFSLLFEYVHSFPKKDPDFQDEKKIIRPLKLKELWESIESKIGSINIVLAGSSMLKFYVHVFSEDCLSTLDFSNLNDFLSRYGPYAFFYREQYQATPFEPVDPNLLIQKFDEAFLVEGRTWSDYLFTPPANT